MKHHPYVLMSELPFIPEMRSAGMYFETVFSSEADALVTRELYLIAPHFDAPLLQWNGEAWAIHPYRAKKGNYTEKVKQARAFLLSINQPVTE